ncbi:putative F-box/LRR-repeat protein 9 [Salvia hispanica]|uniref:putative F-box/LRR-repeat protein 9 n=1 Tax=Salvia hispanica TaxID=49212 RepID=UPI002009933E|nr:putative F-box/LRR-repeat protein 9 [Salvia hispanica]
MERFDKLFSLYHSFPLVNNPHIHPDSPPLSNLRNSPYPPFYTYQGVQICLQTRKFDGNDPAGLYSVDEYFDFHDTPPHKRRRLLEECKEGQASQWLRWMRTNVLKPPKKIPVVASSSVPPSPPWIKLPRNVMANILQRLGAEEVLRRAQTVCTAWWKVSKDPALWRVIDFSNPRQGVFNDEYYAMCRCAVDRSQGQLVDITIQYFGDDELMEYIANRSPSLKRLKLGTCFFISGKCATRMIAKLRQLEELHLTIRPWIGASHIIAIGNSCPLLKSFSCNGFKCKLLTNEFIDHNEPFRHAYALAISQSMPNLRHLQVFAHWMGNKGLELILNGCPHLESLDVRRCFDLDLEGDLGKRCREQIKYLKLPDDSVSDIPWPNCDGGDPFGTSAYSFEDYVYDYVKHYCYRRRL